MIVRWLSMMGWRLGEYWVPHRFESKIFENLKIWKSCATKKLSYSLEKLHNNHWWPWWLKILNHFYLLLDKTNNIIRISTSTAIIICWLLYIQILLTCAVGRLIIQVPVLCKRISNNNNNNRMKILLYRQSFHIRHQIRLPSEILRSNETFCWWYVYYYQFYSFRIIQ